LRRVQRPGKMPAFQDTRAPRCPPA
jgi:hypothetical protein